MTILGPFLRILWSVLSSSCWSWYLLAMSCMHLLLSGHPIRVKLYTSATVRSGVVSLFSCLILSVVNCDGKCTCPFLLCYLVDLTDVIMHH